MSMFKVYGVTMELAIKKARAEIEKLSKENQPKTPEEFETMVKERSEGIYKTMSPAAVGKPLDAPEFAEELIALAKRTTKCHSMHVRVHIPKLNKDGSPVINKRTKKPAMTWAKWSEVKKERAA